MARGNIQLQIAIGQTFSAVMNDIPEIRNVALTSLDVGRRAALREGNFPAGTKGGGA